MINLFGDFPNPRMERDAIEAGYVEPTVHRHPTNE